jgi:hypothetical protein
MHLKPLIRETIFLVMVLYFFAEGLYKLVNWTSFSFWLGHAPLLHTVAGPLKYFISVGEVVLSLILMIPSLRLKGLYLAISGLVLFVLWVSIWHFFTPYFMLPYERLVKHPNWLLKLALSLGLCWIALIGISITEDGDAAIKQRKSKRLRDMAANAQ